METWCLCWNCIQAIKSRGEKVFVGAKVFDVSFDFIPDENEQRCDWCDEVDDLYECA